MAVAYISKNFWSAGFFVWWIAFHVPQAFSELVLFLDDRGNREKCVSPGGIVISEQEISSISFDFSGRTFFMLPIPATAEGTFNGIKVCDIDFPSEKIYVRKKLPLERVKEEKKRIRKVFLRVSKKMWEGNFILPVEKYKKVSWNFGVRRIINGHVSGFHRGIDISASVGTPVLATNSGIVAIAGKFTLEGNLIIIDHGTGIFSIYAHLDRIKVSEGQKVRKGEVIGTVGMTGRATGPHLHFGIKVNRVDVNPKSLFMIETVLLGSENKNKTN